MAVSLVSNFYSYNNHIDILCNTPEPAKFYDNFDGFNNENDNHQQRDEQMEYNSFYHNQQQQQQQQQQQPFEEIRQSYNIENDETYNESSNNFREYPNNFVDSPPDSKEAWPIDYNKNIMHATNSQDNFTGATRKRRNEWMAQNDDENGPAEPKVINVDKEKDNRRKVQGRLGWPDDIDLDLSNELTGNGYISDSLLNFPVFKQEMPSPQNQDVQKNPKSPREAQNPIINSNNNSNDNNDVTKSFRTNTAGQPADQQSNNGVIGTSTSSIGNITGLQNFLQQNGFDGNGNSNQPGDSPIQKDAISDDNSSFPLKLSSRFQYVLAAATSIATKTNEESLTYLNQGQSYEIKLKKLGDLSPFRGKILKSIIKICFHERRLQYMEREQMQLWQASRPGERILDVDIPLSYGLIQVNQSSNSNSNLLNTVEIFWDPMKEVGVYIKVNCISTEFTPKKHGGEKGVPFRIQVETYIDYTINENTNNSNQFDSIVKPLHAAACQIKVFKLKGADRKHKQDREKIQKRPISEQEKYQRSCECTILNDITSDSILSTLVGGYSPEQIKRNISPLLTTSNSPVHINKFDTIMSTFCNPGPPNSVAVVTAVASAVVNPIGISNVSSTNGLCKIMDQNVLSPPQHVEIDEYVPIVTTDSTPTTLAQWLTYHRLNAYASTFSHFSGSDLLRMSKEDLTKICGLADGIRMFNILHSKAITPRLTLFVSFEANIYHAIYLHSNTTQELLQKLQKTPGFIDIVSSVTNSNDNWNQFNQQCDATTSVPSPSSPSSSSLILKFNLFVNGPNGVHVLLTDEVLNNVKDESLFQIDVQSSGNLLMKAVYKNTCNIKNDMN